MARLTIHQISQLYTQSRIGREHTQGADKGKVNSDRRPVLRGSPAIRRRLTQGRLQTWQTLENPALKAPRWVGLRVSQKIESACALSITTQAKPATIIHNRQ